MLPLFQDLEADLHLSINLLRNNRPSNFMPKRMDALPPEMRSRVRSCMAQEQQLNSAKPGLTASTEGSLCKGGSGRRITVAVDDDYDGEVLIVSLVMYYLHIALGREGL